MRLHVFLVLKILCNFMIVENARNGREHLSVCYYRSWSRFKKGKAKFLPKDIDVNLCSVINFAFMKINLFTHRLKGRPHHADDEIIDQLVQLKRKKPSLKIFISIGGWSHEFLPRFHSMARYLSNQETFINSMVKYLIKHDLDGVNIDWEYPGSRAGASPYDKRRFSRLLRKILKKFVHVSKELNRKERYFLTLAVSASRPKINRGYHIPQIAHYVDWVNLMTYNLRNPKQGKTGCPTLMIGDAPNVVDSLKAWMEGGMPPEKINLGLSSYGRTYRLKSPFQHAVGAPSIGYGPKGPFTRKYGILSYYEICIMPWSYKKTWKDSECGVPYSSTPDMWVAYEDPPSIVHKIYSLVKSHRLNGISFWALDFDDFRGTSCNNGTYPLLNAAVKAMAT